MLDQVSILLSKEVGEILKSPDLTLSLLRIYSTLYLNGAAPGYCERSIRRYHTQLKIDGMFKISENIKVKERTLEPGWTGLRYYTALCTHISSETLTDEEAIKLLKTGVLKEADFKRLPDGYKKPEPVKNEIAEAPVQEAPVKKVSKPAKKSKK